MAPLPKAGHRSRVWDYFETLSVDSVTCKLCCQVLQKPASSSTSNFNRHLRSRHDLDLTRPHAATPQSPTEHGSGSPEAPTDATPPSGSAQRSRVWRYIQPLSAQAGLCRLCQKVLRTSHSSSSNFTRHLQTQHALDLHRLTDPPLDPPGVGSPIGSELASCASGEIRSPRSWVWRFFAPRSPLVGQCQLCRKTLKNGQSSTSNFARHLRSNHGITEENQYDHPATINHDTSPGRERPDGASLDGAGPRTFRSGVWQYFREISEREFMCTLCDQVLKTTRFSSTSNFSRHLKNKHEIVPASPSPRKEGRQCPEESLVTRFTSHLDEVDPNSESPSSPSRPQRSLVWQYFVSLTAEAAICQLCQSILKTCQSSTSNLIKHLKNLHDIAIINVAIDDSRVSPDENTEGENNVLEGEAKTSLKWPDSSLSTTSPPTVLKLTTVNSPVEAPHTQTEATERKLGVGRMHRSLVWNYFQEVTDRSAVCQLCSQVLRTCNSSTSNFTRHLKRKHDIKITEEVEKDQALLKDWIKDQRPDSESVTKPTWQVEDLMETIFVNKPAEHSPASHETKPMVSIMDDEPEDVWNTHGRAHEESSSESDQSTESDDEANRVKTLKSPVWDYFQQLTSEAAICKVCQTILRTSHSSTSNLLRHLRKQHDIRIEPDPTAAAVGSGDQSRNEVDRSSHSGRRSEVWQYFQSHPSGGLQCNLCHIVLKSGSSKTSNFYRHLRAKHGVVCVRQPLELVVATMTEEET
ncbi:hypothetical protein TCAL_03920 [Tigriopus californicus]|uniref:BED-type domain-containing protein n=1 Tax=Tigriopus californicus TaxID=6832 RepID=A0A553NFB9_TIGCA|nr:hypothetical protein TCAL_03920 [Tigriopus californicus]|eukprot:TCALIF_03920-PA protein Name:"Protein of unknown function" AED:0.37 eAED:0.40 QI:0/-1/0/1/-1/1/1/0/747